MSTACPACGAERHSVFVATPVDRDYFNRRADPARILRCDACASLFQDPWPTHDELQGLYQADYQNYAAATVPLLAALTRRYERYIARTFIGAHGRDAAVLDFGCGQGGFLRSLRDAGSTQLTGFDFVLYPELSQLSGARFVDDLAALVRQGERFDVIRMSHVIEHLTDPDGTMRALQRLLAPGGCIAGQTPNPAHYTARLMGSFWGPLHYPYHTVLFSTAGLGRAASRWNLRLAHTAGTILPTGWAMSLDNHLKDLSGSRTRGRTAAYTLLMAACLPLALLDRALSRGATANFDFRLEAA
jgi:SAM-dependent methyltransferase